MEMPNLIAIQRNSYNWFLEEGLKETFEEVSPITDFSDTLQLDFLTSSFGEPKYSVEECKDRDATYAAPLRIKVRLLNKESGEIKEQDFDAMVKQLAKFIRTCSEYRPGEINKFSFAAEA